MNLKHELQQQLNTVDNAIEKLNKERVLIAQLLSLYSEAEVKNIPEETTVEEIAEGVVKMPQKRQKKEATRTEIFQDKIIGCLVAEGNNPLTMKEMTLFLKIGNNKKDRTLISTILLNLSKDRILFKIDSFARKETRYRISDDFLKDLKDLSFEYGSVKFLRDEYRKSLKQKRA